MTKTSASKALLITSIIMICIFLIRLPYMENMPAEMGDYWRQPDTESIARNFAEKRFNILYPQFNYGGPPPNYVQLEFQLTTFLIAILYKLFGYHYWLARLVPLSFFMLSALYLFFICRRLFSIQQAWAAMAVYGVLPLNLFFSRAIMPEAALLCFFVGAYYYFIIWIKDEKLYSLILAALFTCLAISQKTPAVFLGIAMLPLCLVKYKARFLLKWELWLFALISLVPNLLYYSWSYYNAEWKFVSGIAIGRILPELEKAFLSPKTLEFLKVNMIEAFGILPLILAAVGLIYSIVKREKFTLFWLFSVVLEVIIIMSVIHLKYYLIMLGPLIAMLSGIITGLPWKNFRYGSMLSIALVVFIFVNSYTAERKSFAEVQNRMDGAQILVNKTKKQDLVVIGTFDPAILSISGRAGWTANLSSINFTPRNPEADIAFYKANGAKYFLVYKKYIYGDKGNYYKYIDSHFKRAYQGDGFTLYRLY